MTDEKKAAKAAKAEAGAAQSAPAEALAPAQTPAPPAPIMASPPQLAAVWLDPDGTGPVSWLGLDFAPGEAVAVTAAQAEQIRANRFFEVEEVQEDA